MAVTFQTQAKANAALWPAGSAHTWQDFPPQCTLHSTANSGLRLAVVTTGGNPAQAGVACDLVCSHVTQGTGAANCFLHNRLDTHEIPALHPFPLGRWLHAMCTPCAFARDSHSVVSTCPGSLVCPSGHHQHGLQVIQADLKTGPELVAASVR